MVLFVLYVVLSFESVDKILWCNHLNASSYIVASTLTWYYLFCMYMYTAISRKVVGKTVHATIPKGNIGYDQRTFPDTQSCRIYFCCFPLALENIRPWPLVPFSQISLKNSELKITHSTFRDCCVHFFQQPFLK